MTNMTESEIDGEYVRGQVFRPEVWSAAALQVLRSNIATVSWNQTAPEAVATAQAYHALAAARKAEIAAMEARLATFPAILQPIIALHSRDGRQCMGCDVDGYECEQPEWPCRTIKTILGDAHE